MRTLDAAPFNVVMNHPLVRPRLGLPELGVLDLGPLVANPANYAFFNGEGGFLCQSGAPNFPVTYECHTIFPPNANRTRLVQYMHECIRYMFENTPCREIVTQIPDDNYGADKLADLAGFVEHKRVEDAWKPGVGVSHRSLTLDTWRRPCSTGREAGKAFHSAMEPISVETGVS